jgi:hypothetical protein
MITFDFTLVIDADPDAPGFEDRIFAAGMDDATIILQNGQLQLSFDRKSISMDAAVQSAVAQVDGLGHQVLRVIR